MNRSGWAIALAVAMTLGASACGSEDDENETQVGEEAGSGPSGEAGDTSPGSDADDSGGTSDSGADDNGSGDGSTSAADGDSAEEGDPPLGCDEKVCGSDFEAAEFCGPPCPKGQGCSEDGVCGAWPPHIDQIYDGAGNFQLPPCDYADDPGANLGSSGQYAWIKTMRPMWTDCPDLVQQAHPLAMLGSVVPEDQGVYVNGSCVEYSDGQWGTAYDGTIVWGQTWPGFFQGIMYWISWRAVIDHNLDPPAGIGIAHIHGIPALDCEIQMDVTYEQCPTHRTDCGNYPTPY